MKRRLPDISLGGPVRRAAEIARTTIGLGLASALFPAPAVQAQPVKQPVETFVVGWNIVPENAMLGESQTVKPRTSIGRALLRPASALTIADPVLSETSGQVIGPTEILANVTGSLGSPIGCKFKVSDARAAALIAFGGEKYHCLIDTDRNGEFDRMFTVRSHFAGVLAGRLEVPKRTQAISPVRFTQHDPKAVRDAPHIYVQYAFSAGLAGTLIFQTCLNRNEIDPRACLTASYTVKTSALPASFEAFGARFTVKAKDKSGVSVSMDRNFVEQPLTLLIQDRW